MNTKRKSYISSCEISTIESVKLGGYQQKIAIEGKSKKSFQGETDIVTATNDVIRLLDRLNNENFSYTVLPNVGHFPSETAMKEICEKINQMAIAFRFGD